MTQFKIREEYTEKIREYDRYILSKKKLGIRDPVLSAYVIENETEFKNRPDKQYGFPFLSVRSYGHGKKDYLNYFLNRRKFLQKTKFFADN